MTGNFKSFRRAYIHLADTLHSQEDFEQHIHDEYVKYKSFKYKWESPVEYVQVTLEDNRPETHWIYLKIYTDG